MIKVLGNPENKRWTGDTKGLLELRSQGMELRYEISTGVPEYAVRYAPRTKTDPMPWVQASGLESRLRSSEIVAIDAEVFAAWEAQQDAKTDTWIASIDRSLSTKTAPGAPAVSDPDQGCGAVDAADLDACGHCADCTPAVKPKRYSVEAQGMRFAVRSLTGACGAPSFSSRYAAQDKADRLEKEADDREARQATCARCKRYAYTVIVDGCKHHHFNDRNEAYACSGSWDRPVLSN